MIEIRHPEYNADDWVKWRLTYKGGTDFIDAYLKELNTSENLTDFVNRKAISYCPAFAKGAVNEIKNAIFQRTNDISRECDSPSYMNAILGKDGGVNLCGNTMNSFIGRELLPDLLTISKVGVYVDMPSIDESSRRADVIRPYLYKYKAEDILSWSIDYSNEIYEFDSLLLRDTIDVLKDGLPSDTKIIYRYLWKSDGIVYCKFMDEEELPIDKNGKHSDIIYTIDLPMIPFAVAELTSSLLVDISDYQIAHLNLASSDISYAFRSNFPFYVEQVDYRTNNNWLKEQDENIATAANKEISVGVMDGRQYSIGTEKPGFIHPSAEPLNASMAKQEIMKQEIKQLLQLAITSIEPKMASAESKNLDQQGLEAGLSYIGLELESIENKIAKIWCLYTGSQTDPTIKYPKKYSLQSDADKRQEVKELKELLHSTPSRLYKIEITKRIAKVILGDKVSNDRLDQILVEIEQAKVLDVDPNVIVTDVERGLVDLNLASEARGYPKGSADKAKEDHAERIKRIQAAQIKVTNGASDTDDEVGRTDKQIKENAKETDNYENKGRTK